MSSRPSSSSQDPARSAPPVDWRSLCGEAFPGSSQGASFRPSDQDSSSRPASSDLDVEGLDFAKEVGRETNQLAVERVRHSVQHDSSLARAILARYNVESVGWCELVGLKPTKEGGYIQVSYDGANKFAVLQEVVLWAQGASKDIGDDCSHLCHQPRCRVLGHIVAEPGLVNQSRKNCLVWLDCHHCSKKLLVCSHDPVCIKFCPGFRSMAEFVEQGVCRILFPSCSLLMKTV